MLVSRQNTEVDLSASPRSYSTLVALWETTKGKGEGTVKCTLTKHRIAKAAILFGVQILLRREPSDLMSLILKWSPQKKSGPKGPRKQVRTRVRSGLTLECSSTQGVLEGVDQIWRLIHSEVSHRRVMTACLCLGLDSLARVDPGKMRQIVSRLVPVPRKYWDPELGLWL